MLYGVSVQAHVHVYMCLYREEKSEGRKEGERGGGRERGRGNSLVVVPE